eukprot:299243-Amorphochlora_amoeboformis.AAC.1
MRLREEAILRFQGCESFDALFMGLLVQERGQGILQGAAWPQRSKSKPGLELHRITLTVYLALDPHNSGSHHS